MTKIRIVAIGKDKQRWVTDGVAHYVKLLQRYARLELVTVSSPSFPASATAEQIRRKEATLLKKQISTGLTVALSDRGQSMDSLQIAQALERWQSESGGRLCFVIGGAHGLDDSILSAAAVVLSLSPLTFSHQLVRLVLLEQLYRGFSILHHTDYHK